MIRTSAATALAGALLATGAALPALAAPPGVPVPVATADRAEPAASVRPLEGRPTAAADEVSTLEFNSLELGCFEEEPTQSAMWVTYRNTTDQVRTVTFAFTGYYLEPTTETTFTYDVAPGTIGEFAFEVPGGVTYRFWELTTPESEFDTMVSTHDCVNGDPFSDSDYFADQFGMEIDWMFQQGLSTGWVEPDGTRTYRGLQPMARDAMAAFLYRLYGSPDFTVPDVATFTDVPAGTQFHREIEWLASVGITTGWDAQGAREFRPLAPVNRDAMAAFLHRYSQLENPSTEEPPADAETFVDVPPGTQHFDAIMWMKHTGISEGWAMADGWEYRPVTPVARDAIAAFVFRYIDNTAYWPKA